MKHFSIVISAICVASILCSCDNRDKEVKGYLQTLSGLMKRAKTDSIHMLYPGVTGLEEFHYELLTTENCEITKNDDKTLSVKFKDCSAILEHSDIHGLTVKDSHGLIAFPKELYKFAISTGWVKDSMSDLEKNKRLEDNGFVESISQQFVSDVKRNLSAKLTDTAGDQYFEGNWVSAQYLIATVTNKNSFAIPGEAYALTFRDWYWGDRSMMETRTEQGKEVPANGTVNLRSDVGCNMESESDVLLKINEDVIADLFFANYQANGTEYQEYLNSKQ